MKKSSLIILGVIGMVTLSLYKLPKTNFANVNSFDEAFKKYGAEYGIDWKILKGIASVESSLNPNATNKTSSAYGLMQMTKGACETIGVDWNKQNTPEYAIMSGAKYLKWIITNYKYNLTDAIRAYYAGAGTISKEKNKITITSEWQKEALAYSSIYLKKVMEYSTAYSLQVA